MRLAFRPPLAAGALRAAIAAHLVPGLERAGPGGAITRAVRAPGGPAAVTVDLGAGGDAVDVVLRPARTADRAALAASVRRWLDLDAEPGAVAAALGGDPVIGPLVAARPGLRVVGATDGFETAALVVLGQQVSLAAARTVAGRLVAAFGEPAPEGLTAFPRPEALAEAGAERIREATRVTGARARALHALAGAVAGGLALDPGADPAAVRAGLLALPGIGPWTADVVGVRALGDRDGFAAGDLVLRRALGVSTAREARERAEAWRPFRAYALFHLWTAAAFLPGA
ncbi:MAG: DNA-3-methyladenine glycosylase [Thermoleophilia bacterium]